VEKLLKYASFGLLRQNKIVLVKQNLNETYPMHDHHYEKYEKKKKIPATIWIGKYNENFYSLRRK
jgi:hypothetical protein